MILSITENMLYTFRKQRYIERECAHVIHDSMTGFNLKTLWIKGLYDSHDSALM